MHIKRKGQRPGQSFSHEPPLPHGIKRCREKSTVSASRHSEGPWMSREVLARVPKTRREFDLSRDPSIGPQLEAMKKTEAQRREEQTGRGSGMVGEDQPMPVFRPPQEISKPVDEEHFNSRWMREHCDAVMRQAVPDQPHGREDFSRAFTPLPKSPSL